MNKGTAGETMIRMAYGDERLKVIQRIFEEGVNKQQKRSADMIFMPTHIDVTRRGKWITTLAGRYKVPLSYDHAKSERCK